MRCEQAAAAQGSQKVPPPSSDPSTRRCATSAMSDLLLARWVAGEAAERGITRLRHARSRTSWSRSSSSSSAARSSSSSSSSRLDFTPQQARDRVELQLLSDEIQKQVLPAEPPSVSDSEVEDFYDANKSQFAAAGDARRPPDRQQGPGEGRAGQGAAGAGRLAGELEEGRGEVLHRPGHQGQRRPARRASPRARASRPSTSRSSPPPQGQLVGPFKGQAGYYLIEVDKITPAQTDAARRRSARRSSSSSLRACSSRSRQNFQQDFIDKWTSRTFCADGYVIDRCARTSPPTTRPSRAARRRLPAVVTSTRRRSSPGQRDGVPRAAGPGAAAGADQAAGPAARSRRGRRPARPARRSCRRAPRRQPAPPARRRPALSRGSRRARSGAGIATRSTALAPPRRDHPPAAPRVPLGPRAGRALDRPAHGRGGLELADAARARRRREAPRRARRRAVPGPLPGAAARGARRREPRRGRRGHDREKLIRRHPHVFGESAEAEDARGEVLRNWDRIKREEEGRGADEPFADVPENLPALLYARKVQRRAASAGLEGAEPRRADRRPALRDAAEAWIGEALFALVDVARRLRVDPELRSRCDAPLPRPSSEGAPRLDEFVPTTRRSRGAGADRGVRAGSRGGLRQPLTGLVCRGLVEGSRPSPDSASGSISVACCSCACAVSCWRSAARDRSSASAASRRARAACSSAAAFSFSAPNRCESASSRCSVAIWRRSSSRRSRAAPQHRRDHSDHDYGGDHDQDNCDCAHVRLPSMTQLLRWLTTRSSFRHYPLRGG